MHCAGSFRLVGRHCRETTRHSFALRVGELHGPVTLEGCHLLCHRLAIAPTGIEQKAFEIRADLDIHRRGDRWRHSAGRIITFVDRPGQNVVNVCRDYQAVNGQPHLLRDIARKNIAEITGRHAEGHLAIGRPQLERGVEVVNHLRH